MKTTKLLLVGIVLIVNIVSAQTVSDTLDEHFKNSQYDNYPVFMGESMIGYMAGYSFYEDQAVMQLFDEKYGLTSDGVITELLFLFALRTGNPSMTIRVKVWDDNNGIPGNVLDSVILSFAEVPTITTTPLKTINAVYNTIVKFPTPVVIPDNHKFWAGFSMYVTPTAMKAGDTIALATSSDTKNDAPGITGDFSDAITHTFVHDAFGNFRSFPDVWQMDIALAVFPVVQLTTSIKDIISRNGLKLYYHSVFNNTTTINYELDKSYNNVILDITDITGKMIMSYHQGMQNIGKHSVTVDVSSLSKGIYFYTLKTEDTFLTRKMLVN